VNAQQPASDTSVLYRLHAQLTVLTPVLTAAAGHPGTVTMLTSLRTTTAEAADLLAFVEPAALAAIRQGLEHAACGEYNASCSELLHAHRCLSILLRRDDQPRRIEAANEPTRRWQLET
jgi:hypothetical protein